MYDKKVIKKLIAEIEKLNGIGDKDKVAGAIHNQFELSMNNTVHYRDEFAIRFSYSKRNSPFFSNTILSLSQLKKYDTRPFFVCLVTPEVNYLYLANTTLLKKISHSSKDLRVDNIRGSFNGSDIFRSLENISNIPANFEELYAIHEGFTFEENLQRLVATTNDIQPRRKKFSPNDDEKGIIFDSPRRALKFLHSEEYKALNNELNQRVEIVQKEISRAAMIDNVNLRGRAIEYLITSEEAYSDSNIRLNDSLLAEEALPSFTTDNDLGDFDKNFLNYTTKTDIKTKMLNLSSNPKGYNIDKILEFLSLPKSVYLVYIVTINHNYRIKTKLSTLFNSELLKGTRIFHHWAGRNSRGVTQYSGHSLHEIVNSEESINIHRSMSFLEELLKK